MGCGASRAEHLKAEAHGDNKAASTHGFELYPPERMAAPETAAAVEAALSGRYFVPPKAYALDFGSSISTLRNAETTDKAVAAAAVKAHQDVLLRIEAYRLAERTKGLRKTIGPDEVKRLLEGKDVQELKFAVAKAEATLVTKKKDWFVQVCEGVDEKFGDKFLAAAGDLQKAVDACRRGGPATDADRRAAAMCVAWEAYHRVILHAKLHNEVNRPPPTPPTGEDSVEEDDTEDDAEDDTEEHSVAQTLLELCNTGAEVDKAFWWSVEQTVGWP